MSIKPRSGHGGLFWPLGTRERERGAGVGQGGWWIMGQRGFGRERRGLASGRRGSEFRLVDLEKEERGVGKSKLGWMTGGARVRWSCSARVKA